jgi:ABC-type dipeptide/oligopeptide/nickel transport system ATPase subunit
MSMIRPSMWCGHPMSTEWPRPFTTWSASAIAASPTWMAVPLLSQPRAERGSEMAGSKFPLAGMKVKDMKRIADEELRTMGIVFKDIDQPIGTLSGGQRQRVAMARAV